MLNLGRRGAGYCNWHFTYGVLAGRYDGCAPVGLQEPEEQALRAGMTRPQTWERYIGYILCEEKRLVGTV